MPGLKPERANQQAEKKPYSTPEAIKYDTLKELTLCTCRHPYYCNCSVPLGGDDCECDYTNPLV